MKHFLLGTALLACLSADAQMNRVGIGLVTLGTSRRIQEDPEYYPNTGSTSDYKALLLLPTIGYYRMINKPAGLGLELGYGRENVRNERVQTTPALRQVTMSDMTFSYYYVCPSVIEMFNSAGGKYRFIASVSVPISISPKQASTATTYGTDLSSGVTSIGSEITSAPTSKLGLGIYLNGSVFRKIAGNLYAGAQLGIGATRSVTSVAGNSLVVSLPGTDRETRRENYSKTVTNQTNLAAQPMVCLNYFF